MMNFTIFYPDGTSEVRPATEAELEQIEIDEQQKVFDAWQKLRNQRNVVLAACDWTVLPDSPTSTAAWKVYRQALRDLPANTTDPFNVDWPTPPS